MLSNQIRRAFVNYFVEKGHRHLPSSSVVPHDDPTLLFCNAGMNQFKSYFLGKEEPPSPRAVTSQKCIRVGGKHNDLENVGHTTRHLTFFEMLGNFSFGDYFKKEAIDFAWEVSLKVFGLDLDRLWVSVFEDDDEAYELWRKYLPEKKIARLGAADNFWQMGDVGPCGPCTELLFDRGKEFGDIDHPLKDVHGERYFEFWNLVFMQYNKERNGDLKMLPKPSVDTGMGMERLISLKMGVNTVFETDILRALIAKVEDHFKVKFSDQNKEYKAAFCVISDHLRSLAFAIADGATPSNVDRGYVLRKLLRRAVRYGRMLGAQKPFLADILPELVLHMHEDFPEIKKSEEKIKEILTLEEEAFLKTLKRGGNLLNQVIKQSKESKQHIISGEDAFLLKDTYGLPLDEIQLVAKDSHLTVDIDQFKKLEKRAKEISKNVHQSSAQEVSDDFYKDFSEKHPETHFCGYDHTRCQAKVIGIIQNEKWVDSISNFSEGIIVLDKTPFYAEKGGQVGDNGVIENGEAIFEVKNTTSPYSGIIAHSGKMGEGTLKVGEVIQAKIDSKRRDKIAANHTATHLLHWALQKILGEHIKQAGSLVEASRLRFDFSHHKALSADQICEIEDLINQKIRENNSVESYEISFQEAQKKPEIKQFFGEKYGLEVRVVDIDYSKELCGGNHAKRVGDLGFFKIVKESSIAAGVRRIEALTGQEAIDYTRAKENELVEFAKELNTTPAKFSEKLSQLLSDHKNLEEHIKHLLKQRNLHLIEKFLKEKQEIKNVPFYKGVVDLPAKELRDFVMQMGEMQNGVFFICSHEGESVSAVVHVSKDLSKEKISAKDLLSASIDPISGKGGGKTEFAQAGGSNPKNIPHVFEKAEKYLENL